jgi:hypothetical protein
MTEADLYTVESLRPRRGRAWLVTLIVCVAVLGAWCAWLGFEAWRVAQYTEHAVQVAAMRSRLTVQIAELCFEGGGTWSDNSCDAPQVTFSIIPFSQGAIPTPAPDRRVPLPGEPVMPIPPPASGDSTL